MEPVGVDNTGNVPVDSARKGVPVEVRIQHTSQDPEDVIQLTFESLDTSEMQKAMQAMQSGGGHSEDDGHGHPPGEGHGMPGSFTLYADVTLNINGVEQKIRPALRMAIGPAGMQPDPIPLRIEGLRQGSGYTLLFRETNLEPGNLTANFGFVPDVAVAQGYFQVLHVPGIQVLWFGVYIMIAGAFLSWRRRSKLALQPVGSPRKKPESGLDATARAEAEQELERELGSAE